MVGGPSYCILVPPSVLLYPPPRPSMPFHAIMTSLQVSGEVVLTSLSATSRSDKSGAVNGKSVHNCTDQAQTGTVAGGGHRYGLLQEGLELRSGCIVLSPA